MHPPLPCGLAGGGLATVRASAIAASSTRMAAVPVNALAAPVYDPDERTAPNLPEWSVSELSAALKKTVEDAYGFVRVRGEVSGFKGPRPPAMSISASRTNARCWKA